MTPSDLTQLGAAGILALVVIAFYTGRVTTTTAAKETLDRVVGLWQDRYADVVLDRDGWKAQAQQLAPAVEKIAAELEEANRRDEERFRSR